MKQDRRRFNWLAHYALEFACRITGGHVMEYVDAIEKFKKENPGVNMAQVSGIAPNYYQCEKCGHYEWTDIFEARTKGDM